MLPALGGFCGREGKPWLYDDGCEASTVFVTALTVEIIPFSVLCLLCKRLLHKSLEVGVCKPFQRSHSTQTSETDGALNRLYFFFTHTFLMYMYISIQKEKLKWGKSAEKRNSIMVVTIKVIITITKLTKKACLHLLFPKKKRKKKVRQISYFPHFFVIFSPTGISSYTHANVHTHLHAST